MGTLAFSCVLAHWILTYSVAETNIPWPAGVAISLAPVALGVVLVSQLAATGPYGGDGVRVPDRGPRPTPPVQALDAGLAHQPGDPLLVHLQVVPQDQLGVHPRRINEIVLGKRRITADTALRLARFFGLSERFWMNLQSRYDLEIEKDRLSG